MINHWLNNLYLDLTGPTLYEVQCVDKSHQVASCGTAANER